MVTFTEEILNGRLNFLCRQKASVLKSLAISEIYHLSLITTVPYAITN